MIDPQKDNNLEDFDEKMEEDLDPGDMYKDEPFEKETPANEP